MKFRRLALYAGFGVTVAALALLGVPKLRAQITLPLIYGTGQPAAGDYILTIPGGQPSAQSFYATLSGITAAIRGTIGPADWTNNIIENGDFLIDQQYAGTSQTVQTSLTRSMDRWFSIYTVSSSGGSAPTTQQVAVSSGLTIPVDELKFTASGTKTTSATAGMITYTQQTIEGSDVEDLNWGQTTGGTPVTVSLWLKSSLASTNIGVALKGASTVQSYVNNCALSSVAATWTFCSFTIPAPTTGTWTNTLGNAGPVLTIAYQCGTTFQTSSPNSWQTGGPFYCTSAQSQLLATASDTLEIALVKMQRGSTATPFAVVPAAVDLTLLQRYLRTSFPLGTQPAQNGGLAGAQCMNAASATSGANSLMITLQPPLYAAPTITTYDPSASDANWRDVTGSAGVTVSVDPATAKGTTGFEITTGAGTTAAHVLCIHYLADSGI